MALNYSLNDGGTSYSVVQPSCTAGDVVIPSTYNGLPVTAIGNTAFGSCASLTSITIPSSVTEIQEQAFANCISLTSITIPNSVVYLGYSAFEGCTNLSSVTIGTGITTINDSTFQSCTSLINITIPSNVSEISLIAFQGCSNLVSINVDSGSLGYRSVDGVLFYPNLNVLVKYPEGKAGNYIIPSTVTSISNYAFNNSTRLTSVTIPSSVTSIGFSAFSGCTGLTGTLTIPNSVTIISGSAFNGCAGLTGTLTIPNSVTSITNQAFAFTGFTSITIPNSVTSIASYVFYGCTNLNNITIPKNVTTIGSETFRDCTSLTRINFLGNAPSLGTNVFLNTNINLKVYRYSTKSGWSSTFGGEDVLLIDSPATGLKTFGLGSSNSGQASVKKTNIVSGRLTLSKFDPKNISDIALWTKQDSLNFVNNYSVIYLFMYAGNYSEGDIDTDYYADDNTFTSYTGAEFGFTITYDESVGLWYLIDPNENEIAFSEDLLASGWYTYNGLDYFELNTYETESFTSTGDTIKFIWLDVSGKNNHLTSRPFPRNSGINSAIIGNYFNPFNGPSNLETKGLSTPLKTTNIIDLLNPFTIYMVLWDGYTGTSTRKILGISGRALTLDYSNLYLESTASGALNHTFSLKYYNSLTGITQTAFSVNLNKSVFASSTYQFGSSILKLSSNYTTTSASPIRTMTLTYYNLLKNTTISNIPNIGSVFGTGNIEISNDYAVSRATPSLYISSDSYGQTLSSVFLLSEVVIYNKFLNATEDASINRYLQRKYYGKLLP
jgi:hypothetical protein